MSGLGQTFRRGVYDYLFRNQTTPIGTTNYYISLHTGDPGVDGQTANEVSTSGTAYARQTIAIASGGWSAATSAQPSVITNAAVITYATATGAGFGTITFFGIWKTVSGTATTDFVGSGPVSPSQAVAAGNTASFAIGALSMSINYTP